MSPRDIRDIKFSEIVPSSPVPAGEHEPTLERIRDNHSAIPHDWPHNAWTPYKQKHDERCYICTLLSQVASLQAERDGALEEAATQHAVLKDTAARVDLWRQSAEQAERQRDELLAVLRHIAFEMPTSERNPDGDEQAAHAMQFYAQAALSAALASYSEEREA